MGLSVGVLSGTSADGIDVAVVKNASTRPEILAAGTYSYTKKTKNILSRLPHLSAEEVCFLHALVARESAKAVNALIKKAKLTSRRISVIGSHGQTVFHLPGVMSLQVGAPAIISELTGIQIAADFRIDDIAAGGQGAPLAPVLDQILLAKHSKRTRVAALNLGGMANITVIENGSIRVAYDTGPANFLIDQAMREKFGKSFDRGGLVARSGDVENTLLKLAKDHSYFKKRPPKSTGFETFGSSLLASWMKKCRRISQWDLITTLTEISAVTISREIIKQKVPRVWVSGGGWKNTYLIERIKKLCVDIAIESTQEIGIDPDYKEAVLFAALGELRVQKKPVSLQKATGARNAKILGGLWLP